MENKDKVILDLAGGSGAWSKLYRDAGYDVRLITLPDYDIMCTQFMIGNTVLFRQRKWYNQKRMLIKLSKIYGILAAPVCTQFSVANETLYKGEREIGIKKQRDFEKGMELVNKCMRIINRCDCLFWCLENPVGYLAKFLGEPQFTFQPWFFGDPWTKRTYLWGRFNKPKREYYEWRNVPKNNNLYIRPKRQKPGIAFLHKSAKQYISSFKDFPAESDSDFRALTPQGFAKAFYEANK